MFSQYFGFQEEPFGATPNPRCIYPSRTHNEALASLKYGFLSNRGFTAMIAPPGLGKTTLLLRFLEEIRESARSVFLFDIDADCEPRDFVAYILRDIGITPANSSSEMHKQLSAALIEETQAGRHFVVVIDEAQNLSDAVLERVRLLTNFETSSGKLLQIVLSGQPELSNKLAQASLVQLRQRVSTICRIDPLSEKEIIAYVDYRLKQSGYIGEQLFTVDALKLISETSQGTPRIINNLCYNSLSLCRALNRKQVDTSIVSEVVQDLQLSPQVTEPITSAVDVELDKRRNSNDATSTRRLYNRWALASASMLLIGALTIFGLEVFRSSQSHKSVDVHSPDSHAAPSSAFVPSAAPFEVTIEANQTLQEIADKYLGGHSPQRLLQIQALNPKITDPNLIDVGQKIWLPGPRPSQVIEIPTPSTQPRKTQ